MYKDIPAILNDKTCSVCSTPLEDEDSPWSVCFDPLWKRNVWGGDSHEYRAVLCQECAERILTPNVGLGVMFERMTTMKLERYRGVPCGLLGGNFPAEVFRPVEMINVPMCIALTTDKRSLLLMDSVDYYQTKSLNKVEAIKLAEHFLALAEAMEA